VSGPSRKVVLSADEDAELQKWIRGTKTEQRKVFRAAIIWHLAHEGLAHAEVASKLNTTNRTVVKWERRFLEGRLQGLGDAPRSGRPSRFGVEERCRVISIACATPANFNLAGYSCWTYDALTEVVGLQGIPMSRSSVVRTLLQNELRPHKMQMWLHSPDPAFREKVNEIVGLYLDPPEDAVVLCIDEKTGMQAIERKYATQSPKPGRPGRYEAEYIRHGTQSLLASFDIKTGHVVPRCGPTRTAEDLLALLEQVASEYQDAKRIIVLWDNLNIHHDGKANRWTAFNERHGGKFEFRYTPLHASWVNQVEVFFSILHKRCLKYGSFTATEDLREKVLAFIARWNKKDGHPFDWCFRGYPIQSTEKEVA
jgi:transposase